MPAQKAGSLKADGMSDPSVVVGPFRVVARGPLRSSPVAPPAPRMTNLVRRALLALDDDVDWSVMLPPGSIPVRFGWVANIPGTSSPAAGYTVNGPAELVRWGYPGHALSADGIINVVLHEGFGHCRLALKPITPDQMTRALQLLTVGPPLPAFSDPHEVWKSAPGDDAIARKLKLDTPYWLEPYECLINDLVKALSDNVAPWDRQYRRHVADADLPKLKALWLEGLAPQSPAPQPPTPPPPDDTPTSEPVPTTDDLQAQLDAANAQIGLLTTALQSCQKDRDAALESNARKNSFFDAIANSAAQGKNA